MNDQQWPRLKRWLRLLPRNRVEQNPELLLLEAWIYHIRHHWSEMATCLDKVETLISTSLPGASASAEHLRAHYEALRGFQSLIATDSERAIIHNNRFRIDALALQALLHNARDKHPVALEKLTAALNLAEPGGFIRPFVDLGPRMADLLKQLIKQNVAVGYIKRILDAFKEDEHMNVPDASEQNSASTHLLISQPLVEPLSNREIEILELVSQRLRDKEIAAKLFISYQTVKKHRHNIYGKLNVSDRRKAVEKAQKLGILAAR